MDADRLEFDVVIVGAGPAGLAAAIRLAQCARGAGRKVSVCVIDKAPAAGAHILSGAILDPAPLDALLPGWRARAPKMTTVADQSLLWLGPRASRRIPRALVPPSMRHGGQSLVRAGHLVAWLATEAEQLGIDVIHGFAAQEALFDADGAVCGVRTGAMGLCADGKPGPRHQPGMRLHAAYTLFAEGCRGHLGRQLETRFGLREGRRPQHYALGLKELWRVPPGRQRAGEVVHTMGWPLGATVGGGGFLYAHDETLLSVGLIVALDYANPWLSPFAEFQRFKTHPAVSRRLEGGERLAYGARALCHGGLLSLPELVFPGGALLGDDAGFLDPARQQGMHNAMRSGMLAAEACFDAVSAGRARDCLAAYPKAVRGSPIHAELHRTRNFKPGMQRSALFGAALCAFEQHVLHSRVPWTLTTRAADHTRLHSAADFKRIDYPAPDGRLSFDLASSLAVSNLHHTPDQPCHLRLADPECAIKLNLARHAGPEQRYCPAGVYEFDREPGGDRPRFLIHAENCLHCKCCDIKDPGQNITWVPPQGGEGPAYDGM